MGVIFKFSQNFIRVELPKNQLPASQKGLVKGLVKELAKMAIGKFCIKTIKESDLILTKKAH